MTLAGICADVGIEIIPTTQRPGPGQTTARATLQDILRDHGEGHTIQLLRTFTETENRTRARIDAFSLHAISDILIAYPEWADSGLRWFEVFDGINLGAIQRQARANRDAVPQRWGLGTLLHRELAEAFAEKQDVAPPKQTARQRTEALAAKAAAIVEKKVALGRELAAVRATVSSNRKFGAIIRRQFDIHNATEVGEMARIARLYGDRPEIYRTVGWNALVQLSSPSTPEDVRQKLEARILEGERVSG